MREVVAVRRRRMIPIAAYRWQAGDVGSIVGVPVLCSRRMVGVIMNGIGRDAGRKSS